MEALKDFGIGMAISTVMTFINYKKANPLTVVDEALL